MKYLKAYENNNIKVGDYVLTYYIYDNNEQWTNYINNIVGQVVRIYNNTFEVKYIINNFAYNILSDDDKRPVEKGSNGSKYIIIHFTRSEIKDTASTAIKLETKILAKKFNL